MNILTDLSKDHAKQICKLINKPFLSLSLKKEYITIIFSSETKESVTNTEEINIYPSGQVEFYLGWYDSEAGDDVLYPINSLPITDYLRKEGFEFVYKSFMQEGILEIIEESPVKEGILEIIQETEKKDSILGDIILGETNI